MRVFVIAGEASGDKLGAALMAGLTGLTDVTFDGVGGPMMAEQGLVSRFPMDELSVMGLAEILPKYRALKARVRQMAQAVLDSKPDVLITIDSPDFCLCVAKLVKAGSDIRCVHYVAPTVWAWRPKRAAKMARHIDQVLALFPFEPPLMQAAGMRCDFVGHPVVTDPIASTGEAAAWEGDGPLVMLLPGSRRGEIARLLPRFGQAAALIARARPDVRFALPTTANVYDGVVAGVAEWDVPVQILTADQRAEKRGLFASADVALAASGTVSLELAANDTPMVIAYDMAWLSRIIIGWMLLVDTVTLVNLVSDSRVIPEFVGKDCVAAQIAAAVLRVLDDPTAQHTAMAVTMDRLGRGGDAPGVRAARAVLDGIAVARRG
ncbi:MAG: lipid-A-disaccharide synthase [Gammaproteobacteria bacterium]|jgi:lipid-A-disaccharide synthase